MPQEPLDFLGEYQIVLHYDKGEIDLNSNIGMLVRTITEKAGLEEDSTPEYINPTHFTIHQGTRALNEQETTAFWQHLQHKFPDLKIENPSSSFFPHVNETLMQQMLLLNGVQHKLEKTATPLSWAAETSPVIWTDDAIAQSDITVKRLQQLSKTNKIARAGCAAGIDYNETRIIRNLSRCKTERMRLNFLRGTQVQLKKASRAFALSTNFLKRRQNQPTERGDLGVLEDLSLATTETMFNAMLMKKANDLFIQKLANEVSFRIGWYCFPLTSYGAIASFGINLFVGAYGLPIVKKGIQHVVPQSIQDCIHFSRNTKDFSETLKTTLTSPAFAALLQPPKITISLSCNQTRTNSNQFALTFKDLNTFDSWFNSPTVFPELQKYLTETHKDNSPFKGYFQKDTVEINFPNADIQTIFTLSSTNTNDAVHRLQHFRFYEPSQNTDSGTHFYLDLIKTDADSGMPHMLSSNANAHDSSLGISLFSAGAGGTLAYNPTLQYSMAVDTGKLFSTKCLLGSAAFGLFALGVSETIAAHRKKSWSMEQKAAWDYQTMHSALLDAVDQKISSSNYGLPCWGLSWNELKADRADELRRFLTSQQKRYQKNPEIIYELTAKIYDLDQKNWEGVKKWNTNSAESLKRFEQYFKHLNKQLDDLFAKEPINNEKAISTHLQALQQYFPKTFSTGLQSARYQLLKNAGQQTLQITKNTEQYATSPEQKQQLATLNTLALLNEILNHHQAGLADRLQKEYQHATQDKHATTVFDEKIIQAYHHLFLTQPKVQPTALTLAYQDLSLIANPDIKTQLMIAHAASTLLKTTLSDEKPDLRKQQAYSQSCLDACDAILTAQTENTDIRLLKADTLAACNQIENASVQYDHIIQSLEKQQNTSKLTDQETKMYAATKFGLAKIQIQQGNYETSIPLMQSGMKHQPNNGAQQKLLCQLYLQVGDTKSARTETEKYLENAPTDTEMLQCAIQIEVATGNTEKVKHKINTYQERIQTQLDASGKNNTPEYQTQMQTLQTAQDMLNDRLAKTEAHENDVIANDAGRVAGKLVSMGLRAYANQQTDQKSTRAKAARVTASAVDLAVLHVGGALSIKAVQQYHKKMGLAVKETSYLESIQGNWRLCLHSAAIISQTLLALGIENERVQSASETLSTISEFVSTTDQADACRSLFFDHENWGGDYDFTRAAQASSIIGDAFSRWVHSHKMNRQFMPEHPGYYFAADLGRLFAVAGGIYVRLDPITKKALAAAITKAAAAAQALIIANPIVAGVIILFGAYLVYKTVAPRIKAHYEEKTRDELFFNAQLALSIADSCEWEARQLLKAGKTAEANQKMQDAKKNRQYSRNWLEKITKEDPNNTRAINALKHFEIADLFQSGQFSQVLTYCKTVIDKRTDPDNLTFYYLQMAEAYIQLQQTMASRALLQACLSILPPSTDLYQKLGGIEFLHTGNYRLAIHYFQAAKALLHKKIEQNAKSIREIPGKLYQDPVIGGLAEGGHQLVKNYPGPTSIVPGLNRSSFKDRDHLEDLKTDQERLKARENDLTEKIQAVLTAMEIHRSLAQGEIGAALAENIGQLLQNTLLLLCGQLRQDDPTTTLLQYSLPSTAPKGNSGTAPHGQSRKSLADKAIQTKTKEPLSGRAAIITQTLKQRSSRRSHSRGLFQQRRMTSHRKSQLQVFTIN